MNDLVSRDQLIEALNGKFIYTLTDIRRLIERQPAVTPQVVANISGGLLQGASADYRVDLYTLDFDDCSGDPETTIILNGGEVWLGQTGAEIDPDFVRSVVESETIADQNCTDGIHSWANETGKLPASTPCDNCGLYGNPE